jgi:hypothetical protein
MQESTGSSRPQAVLSWDYIVTIKRAASWCYLGEDNLSVIQLYKNVMYIENKLRTAKFQIP